MKKIFFTITVLFVFCSSAFSAGSRLDFSVHKMESDKKGPTILVIAGIQGDEPGGFNAASLLVTHYKIKKGNIWIVPNLNFISIIKRSRGVYGDLNRKFSYLKKNDPEFKTILKIKELILNKKVDLILNLHDGSGFYSPVYVDKSHNPKRWGQSIIIDQEKIESDKFGNLGQVAKGVVKIVNSKITKRSNNYHVYDTKTSSGNEDMAKTLTYFAIRNGKPAFGVEASKSFLTHQRTYYHLLVLESFFKQTGIEYDRDIKLSYMEVNKAINSDMRVAFNNSKIMLEMKNARNRLNYIPFNKNSELKFEGSNPLLAVVDLGKNFRVYHGNRRITRLYPQYFEYDLDLDSISMTIDDEENRSVKFGEIVSVNKSFEITPLKNYRVNIIGFKRNNVRNESGIKVSKKDIKKRYSVDKKGMIFRVEVYNKRKFSGMVLVNFNKEKRVVKTEKIALLESN